MQFQIECSKSINIQACWFCNTLFETKEARVIVYDDRGIVRGEACPQCLQKGAMWLNQRFEQLVQGQKSTVTPLKRTVLKELSA
jgi:hypothetical protein